jgi:hypothetical protein
MHLDNVAQEVHEYPRAGGMDTSDSERQDVGLGGPFQEDERLLYLDAWSPEEYYGVWEGGDGWSQEDLDRRQHDFSGGRHSPIVPEDDFGGAAAT